VREAPIRGLQRSLYGQLEDGFAREHSPPSSRGGSESDFEFVEHDVTTHVSIGGELDADYHFASPASHKDFSRIPIDILKVGALGTLNCLGLARAKGARLMLASTSEVYGDPLVHPSQRLTGATSTPSVSGASMMRPSATPRLSPWPTAATTTTKRTPV
jgi:nucleoside-diphosphate-sugar epimerase